MHKGLYGMAFVRKHGGKVDGKLRQPSVPNNCVLHNTIFPSLPIRL